MFRVWFYILGSSFPGYLGQSSTVDLSSRANCTGVGSNAFERNCVVPDLIDIAPTRDLQVRYVREADNSTVLNVDDGNELSPTDLISQPSLVQCYANSVNLYTLSMSDPDAPGRQNFSLGPVNHWLVVNIPGAELQSGHPVGDIVMPYLGPGPIANTGLHRYVILAWEQAAPINASEAAFIAWRDASYAVSTRLKFDILQFAKTHYLADPPVCGNFFQAQNIAVPA